MKFRKIAISVMIILAFAVAIPPFAPKIAVERLFAELGDARAQCNLGVSYLRGDGVATSSAEAYKWFSKAADQDYAYANYALGLHDENSYTVLFSKLAIAADNGVAEAQFRIGRALANMDNRAEAVKRYRKAADQGLADAQFNLGRCYYNGFGVTQDFSARGIAPKEMSWETPRVTSRAMGKAKIHSRMAQTSNPQEASRNTSK